MRRIRYYLLKNHIAPKWTVFIFDNLIGSFAVLFAIFLVDKAEFKSLVAPETITILVVTVLTNTLFFYFFKTYEGIIRFSGFAEVIRVTGALIGSFLCLVTVGIFSSLLGGNIIIPPTILIINLAISSFFMVGYRLVVKGIYKNTMLADNIVNVILYGGGAYGSKLKQTLEQVSNHKYRVIAFIDDEINFVGKAIDNVRNC